MHFGKFKLLMVTTTVLFGCIGYAQAQTKDCSSGNCDGLTLSYSSGSDYSSMNVTNTGTADNTTVGSSGRLNVNSGGSVTNTTVKSNGTMTVGSGGSASTTTIENNGRLNSTSTGVIDELTVNSGGELNLTTDTTITNGSYDGKAFSIFGGAASDVTLSSSSQLEVKNGHSASGTTALSGSTLTVDAGGAASNSTINGTMNVNGTATNTTVDRGHINSTSGTVNTITLTNGGTFHFSTGATVTGVTQDNAIGTFNISSGHAQDVLVNSGSRLDVNSGHTSDHTVVNNNGEMYAEGTSTDVTVDSGGYIESLSGTVTNLDLAQYGEFYFTTDATVTEVEQGGNAGSSTDKIKNKHALDLHVNRNSRLDVRNAGTSENIVVNDDGKMYVYAGGNAHNTDVNNGGYIESLEGTVDRFDLQEFGEFYFTTDATVTDVVQETNSGTFQIKDNLAQDIIINRNSRLDVGRQGRTTAGSSTNVVVNDNGDMYVYEGGDATDTTVNNGGHLHVGEPSYNGGKTTNTTVNSGGLMDVYNKGNAHKTDVAGGTMNIYSGGSAENNTVTNGGTININNGGSTTTTEASNGTVNVAAGGSATDNTIKGTGVMNVSGTATDTDISGSGIVNVYSGGTATNNTIKETGVMNVSGTVTNTDISGSGIANINSGGKATDNTVKEQGVMNVETGATATTTVVGSGDTTAGTANGTVNVATGATANDNIINNGGIINVNGGGLTDKTVINAGGLINIEATGTATNLTVNSGGGFVSNTDTTMSGRIEKSDGTFQEFNVDSKTANNLLVNGNSKFTANNGGKLNNTLIENGGTVDIKNGASANNTEVGNDGKFNVFEGGLVNNTTVYDGGTFTVEANGTATNTIVNTGGTVITDANSVLENLDADSNAILNFDADTVLKGNISIRDDTIMSGDITYDDIFGNHTYDSLTITGGFNENVKEGLINTTAGDRSLNLRNGTFVFNGPSDEYQISGWNKLSIISTAEDKPTVAKLNGDLSLSGTDKLFYISQNSTLDVSGYSPLNINVDANMLNEGLIDFALGDAIGEADDSLHLTGNYYATGSRGPDGNTVGGDSMLRINVDAKNAVADKLVVDGDVAGDTKVILDVTGGNRVKSDILFVESPNDDLSTDASFDIWRVNGSSMDWESIQKEDKNWYLKASGGITPEIIAYGGLPSAGLEQTRSLTRNIKSAINSGMNYNMNCCRTADCNCNCWDDHMINLWVKPVYESTTVKKLYDFDGSITGIEAGVDWFTTRNHKLGVFGSWRQGTYDFSGEGEPVSSSLSSSIDINSYLGGLYYRYDNRGFWALATAFGGIQQIDIETEDDFTADTDAIEYGASLEMGIIIPVTDTLNIEPGASVTYTSLSIDDIHDAIDRDIVYEDARQIEAEAGIKLEKSWLFDVSTLKTYIRPSIVKTFVSGDTVAISDFDDLQTLEDQVLGRVEIGFNYDLLDNVDTYGSLSQTFGGDYQNTSASLGLSYRF